MGKYRYYLGGEFRESNKEIPVINPATEEVFAHIFEADKNDLDFAIEQAKSAHSQWRRVSFKERAKVLRDISAVILDNISLLAELETKEIGKPLKESLFVDIPLAAQCFDYYASFLESLEEKVIPIEKGLDIINYEPYGVCGVYLPYNVPLMIFGFSCASALGAGNALIIKPSEYGSLSILELARYIDKLDIPKGLINIVSGRGEKTGKYLAESNIDIISFTGSRNTLKKIISLSAEYPKKIICELGGANLAVVFSDANKESALENILASSFMKQGQMCIGTSIALIEDKIYGDFLKKLIEKAERIKTGDPFDPTVGMGPVVTKEHLNSIDMHIKDILKRGGRLLRGGKILKHKGYFYPPTIIEIEDMVYEEFFAPVLLVKKFKNNQIQSLVENNPTGLVLQIWSNNLVKAKKIAEIANCGTVWINTFAQMSPQTPFGGTKLSGWGRNLGSAGFFEYVQPKHTGIGLTKSPVEGWFGV